MPDRTGDDGAASADRFGGPSAGVDDDSPREACGVVAVRAPALPVAHLCYLALFALQHRGQESAGIATSDGRDLTVVKDMGLVSAVFDDRTLTVLDGQLGIGHVRYSTTGSSMWKNAQPLFRDSGTTRFAVAHNGNLTNTVELAASLDLLPGTVTSDSDVIGELVNSVLRANPELDLVDAVVDVLPRLAGAYSLVFCDTDLVIGARDPHGFRPLCLGQLDDGWVLASESPALDVVGATFVREVLQGEVVVVDADGVRSYFPHQESPEPKLCVFEFVYFARPDSTLNGHNVHQARVRMGENLAEHHPADADLVMGVPESGIPAAEGFARRSGIPFGHGLVKNRYIGRTFIAPSQKMRALGVRMKLNALRENIDGQRLVVVDDSIVRGTTTKAMVEMLRDAGAVEVHMRVSSPPYRWPCFYGMDTGTRAELLAASMSVDEIRDFLEVDSLAYLSLDGLLAATGAPDAGYCDACLTGDYPVEIPPSLSKHALGDIEPAILRVGGLDEPPASQLSLEGNQ